jgi:uncharacterized protein YwqG
VNSIYTEEYIKQQKERIDKIVLELHEETSVLFIKLTATRDKTMDVFSSKFGGMPYLPSGFVYPRDNNSSFRLLAQLNFEQLPKLTDFPEKGILQFYIAVDDMLGMGVNNDRLTRQDRFRVVYHEEIVRDETKLETPPPIAKYECGMFPFDGEYKLQGEVQHSCISTEDFQFGEQIMPLYNRAFDAKLTMGELAFIDFPNDVELRISKLSNSDGHHIGGYPVFTQGDPREIGERFANHTVLLL